MSMQYEEPQSVTEVNTQLEANPSISQATINAINNLISPPGASTVVVGSYDGTTLVAPQGQTPQMVVVNVGAPVGTDVLVRPPVGTLNTSAWVFDTDANIQFSIGNSTIVGAMARDVVKGVDRVISSGNGNDVLSVLDNGNTTIDGSDGNDTLFLTAGNDSITGNVGNDSVHAGAGDDTIVSGIGIDTVDGGLGFDVVQLAGNASDWTVAAEGGHVMISGAPGSGNAVDAVDIDFISFTGATGNQFSTVVTYTENQAEAMRLYQGLLDRSADLSGAQFWITQADEEVGQIAMANAFMGSPEYLAKYGTQTNTEFVQQLYSNALDRAPEQAGQDFWVNALDTGAASRAQLAITLINSPEGAEKIANVVLVNGLV